MTDDNTAKANPLEDTDRQAPKITAHMARAAIIRQSIEKIETDNAAQKAKRNSKRWRAERKNDDGTDTPDYASDKASKRAEYAAQVEAEGRTVRAYVKVEGDTPAVIKANRLARNAARKAERRAAATQDDLDRAADIKWASRMKKNGWAVDRIESGLEARRKDRKNAYADNPLFGAF